MSRKRRKRKPPWVPPMMAMSDTPMFVPGRGMVERRDLTPADIEKIRDSRSRIEGDLRDIVEQHGGILIDETDERGDDDG